MPLALNVQTGDQQFENTKQIFNLSFTRPTSTWSSQIGVIKAWAIHIGSLCLPKFHMACCSDVSVNKPGSQCKRNKTYISRVSRDKQFQGSYRKFRPTWSIRSTFVTAQPFLLYASRTSSHVLQQSSSDWMHPRQKVRTSDTKR